MRKFLTRLNWLMAILLMVAAVFAILEPVAFLGDSDWPQPLVLVGLAVGSVVILNRLRRWVTTWSTTTYRRVLIGLGILVVVVQILVALSFMDVGRADSYFVRNQAIRLAHGDLTWNHYFLVYPNNVNVTLLEAALLKGLLPLTRTPWLILNLLRFAWVDTGLLAGLFLLKRWRHWRPGAVWLTLLWLLSVPVYAFSLVAYTDALVMPLVLDTLALVTWSLTYQGWRHWGICWGTLLLISGGVALKSNMIVLWLATGCLVLLLWWQRQLSGKKVLGWIVSALVLLGLVLGGMSAWGRQQGYQKDPNVALPVTSWIAMSLNTSSEGQYKQADYLLVDQAPTAAAKQAQATGMIEQRIRKLGALGLAVHLMKKFRVFWATGDFDSFKLTTQWIRAPYWYQNHQREIQFWLVIVTQLLFLMLIFQTIWVLLQRPVTVAVSFLTIMLLGLTVFHVVFWEVEPRYAVPLLPVMMLLGTLGGCLAPTWQFSHAQVRLGRWIAVGVVALCALSLGQTSEDTVIRSDTVGRQGNGDYFTLPVARLAPTASLSWTVPVTGASNALQLQIQPINLSQEQRLPNVQPRYPRGKLRVQVQANGRRLKTWRTTPTQAMAQPLVYPRTTAKAVTVHLVNTGKTTVKYAVGQAQYNQHTGTVLATPAQYPQLYVINVHGPHALTGGLAITLFMGVFLALLWWAI
ncbi:hypothetical protein [Levilactobacillus namurensis]|uniref:Integral membrane protein n=1 Tax=Levilactobacillus namurensis TaxID=380393 RepID=A0AAW8W6K4_9LACO|nr:hypothetical protein [Levilactobacillus namurensis]MDT7014373.1 hypothetical protein [Levilactobacillus namurensis]